MRGPLHGICVLIKENIDTDDRMLTTAGSLYVAPFLSCFLDGVLGAAPDPPPRTDCPGSITDL